MPIEEPIFFSQTNEDNLPFEIAEEDVMNYIDEPEEAVEETEDSSDKIEVPFNPSLIKIEPKQLTLLHIMERLEYGEIKLDPDFQRSFVWEEDKQSRLIESILLKLPIPAFYFDQKDEKNWDVVDGLQRISTIKHFVYGIDKNGIEKKLTLSNLEFLKELEGKKYEDLSRDFQRVFKSFDIFCYIIQKGTPPDVKYNLFKRINTGGLELKPQEIRHALNQGVPALFIKELADLSIFKQATCERIPTHRMEDRDFINRFVAFYLQSYSDYQPDLDSFMTKGMAKIKELSPILREELKNNFSRSMEAAIEIWAEDAFRKRININDTRRPINKALFDCISVNLAKLALADLEILVKRKKIFRSELIKLMNNDKFMRAISQGTGKKYSVEIRFKEIASLISSIINIRKE